MLDLCCYMGFSLAAVSKGHTLVVVQVGLKLWLPGSRAQVQ